MNIFDIIIAGVLLFGFIRGLIKGLFVEVASLVALIIGVYGAIHFSYYLGDWLKDMVSWEEKYISLTAFAITFITIVVCISLTGKLLTKIANFASLGILNKLLGGVFGVLKMGLILSIGFMFFGKINDTFTFLFQENLNESILFEPVKNMAPTIFPFIINDKGVLNKRIEEEI